MPLDPELIAKIRDNDPSITELDLSYKNLTVDDIKLLTEALTQNKKITALNVTGNNFGDAGTELLASCPYLKSLIAAGNSITHTGATALAASQSLTMLDLSHNPVGNKGVEALARNKILKTLMLADVGINNGALDGFKQNTTLTTLCLSDNQLNADHAATLAENTALLSLTLSGNFIGDQGVTVLSKHPTLTRLVVNRCGLTATGAKALAANITLKILDAGNNRVGTEGATALAKNQTLVELYLHSNQLGDEGVAEFGHNNTLRKLNLAFNQINDTGTHWLSLNKTLQYLDLSCNQITFESAHALSQHPALTTLILAYNQMGDPGATQLATSRTITSLDLTGNNVGFEGGFALAQNQIFRRLMLDSNHLGNSGATFLAHNKTLWELFLCYNEVGDPGAIALARNTSLQLLKVNYNQIGEKGRQALQANQSLRSLAISPEQPPQFTTDNRNIIFALAQDFLCICSNDGVIQYFNPAFPRALGYNSEELLAQPLINFLHPDDRRQHANLFQVKARLSKTTVCRFLCCDGSYRSITWCTHPKNDRLYMIGFDITEQEKNRLLLDQTHSKQLHNLEEFISKFCHEIRNPLNGAMGNADNIKEQLQGLDELLTSPPNTVALMQEKLAKSLTAIKTSLQDITLCHEQQKAILDGNIDIAKIAAGKSVLTTSPLDLKKITEETTSIFYQEAKHKGLELILDLSNGPILVRGDGQRLKQILINLISNAIKYTSQGKIIVSVNIMGGTSAQQLIQFKVTDTGIGIDEQDIVKLFKRFSRAKNHLDYDGSGLGLLITKSLTELMEGEIKASSQVGKGSTFTCTIPFTRMSEHHEEKTLPTAKTETTVSNFPFFQSHPKHVLVVEDNNVNQKLLGKMIKEAGYDIVYANNGQDAVEKFKNLSFDIILMDIQMPVMDGITATKVIRQHEQNSNSRHHTPIIAVTAGASESDRVNAMGAGMDDYICKPYSKTELLQKIAMACRPKESSDEPRLRQKNIALAKNI